MSFLTVLGADAKADAAALLTSFAQDDLGKLMISAATLTVDEVETLIDPTDADQRDTALTNFLNAAEVAGKDLEALAKADLQTLLDLAVQAATAAVVSAATSAL